MGGQTKVIGHSHHGYGAQLLTGKAWVQSWPWMSHVDGGEMLGTHVQCNVSAS